MEKLIEKLIEKAIQINKELGAKIEELKELKEPNLMGADGKYFTAKIEDIECKGRVRVEEGDVYLCQDSIKGDSCNDKLGYRYSWSVFNGANKHLTHNGVLGFKLWDYLPKEGDYFYVKTAKDYEFVAIAKNGENLTNRFVSLDQGDGRLNYGDSWFVCPEPNIKELRPATQSEINILDAKLKENGKYFDKESMSIKDIEKEPAFKVGDWVLITKPKDVIQSPTWTYWSYHMDKYDGQTLAIEEINSDGYLVIDGWDFNPDWCTKVEAQKSFKVGDWFIPKKPEDFYNSPIYWDFKMDKFSGKKLKIEAITTSGMLLSNDWKFHPDWCAKVEVPKSETMVNGLKEYFKNTPKAQVVKDWEATRGFDKNPKPNKPKVGDLCIFWNYKKSDAVIGKLTKINYKFKFPYEVADILVYKNCIKFQSMEQYNEFINE